MLVLHTRKIIFIHIPKTGGTSIRTAMYGIDPNYTSYNDTHIKACKARFLLGDIWDEYLSFAVCRDPIARHISHYRDRQRNRRGIGSFSRYLRRYKNVLQRNYVTDINGKLLVTRILRFERLEEDFKELFPGVQLPRVNVAPKKHRKYRQRNLPLERIRKISVPDIEFFGY